MMLFLFIAILARAAALRGGTLSLRHNAGGAAAKALRKVVLGTETKQIADITMRQGLGENTPQHGCGYLGTGYDIIEGNPSGGESSMLDPGFRRPVVALTWSQQSKFNSRDLSKLQPKQGWGIPIDSCQHASSATSISSMKDYTQSLDKSVELEAEANFEEGKEKEGLGTKVSAKYSKSHNYNHFRHSVINTNSEQFELNSYCYEYKMGLNSPARELQLTEYFSKLCSRLPLVEVANTGDCANSTGVCKDMYMPSAGKFLVVDSGQVKLQEKSTGKWFFQKGSVFWMVKDESTQKWKQETPNMVLTASKKIKGKTALTMETKWTKTNPALRSKQRWTYHTKTQSLTCTPQKGGKANAIIYSTDSSDLYVSDQVSKGETGIVRDWVPLATQYKWEQFFKTFGTHFLIEMTLGGRMRTTVTMRSSDTSKLEKTGVSASWAVSASIQSAEEISGGGLSGSDSHHTKQENEALNEFHKTTRETKTFVLGGIPPPDITKAEGFAEWAATVDERPMPVHYKLKSIATTLPFACDHSEEGDDDVTGKSEQDEKAAQKHKTKRGKQRCKRLRETYVVMFGKFQDGALRQLAYKEQEDFLAKQKMMAAAKAKIVPMHPAPPPLPNAFTGTGLHPMGSKIASENKKYYVVMQDDGNLVLYNKMNAALWASNKFCHTASQSGMKITSESGMQVLCNGAKIWDSDTSDCKVKSNGYTKLIIQNNGQLVLKKLNKVLWKTKTTNEKSDFDADKVCDDHWW